ncbi:serine/threonine protein kinase, partial [Streptomyces zinciresistens K42]
QQHPQQPAYGFPQPRQATPPYGGPPLPYLPAAPPEEPRRSGRSTVALVAVALVVALGAGGSVYALMSGGGGDRTGHDPATRGPSASAPADAPAPAGPTASATAPGPSASPADGTVPRAYLGSWTSVSGGEDTRRLTIRQGEVGETVLSLVAEGPAGTGTYHCEFEAPLAGTPGSAGPLRIGPSTVTVGQPPTCSPGGATEVTLLPDGRLERLDTGSGKRLTYTKR